MFIKLKFLLSLELTYFSSLVIMCGFGKDFLPGELSRQTLHLYLFLGQACQTQNNLN